MLRCRICFCSPSLEKKLAYSRNGRRNERRRDRRDPRAVRRGKNASTGVASRRQSCRAVRRGQERAHNVQRNLRSDESARRKHPRLPDQGHGARSRSRRERNDRIQRIHRGASSLPTRPRAPPALSASLSTRTRPNRSSPPRGKEANEGVTVFSLPPGCGVVPRLIN